MNEYQFALALAALIVMAMTNSLPRAWLWIGSGAAAFIFATVWARAGLPHQTFINLIADSIVCLLIYFKAEETWEIRIYNVFQISVAASLLQMGGWFENHGSYILILEVCNWSALAILFLTATLDWIGDAGAVDHWRNYLHRTRHSLRSARAQNPFTRAGPHP